MRRGRFSAGGVIVLAALALSAPAFADSGTAVDQGYPCATAPPGQPCTQPTTPSTQPNTQAPPTSGVAGTKHTHATTPKAATTPATTVPAPAPAVAPVQGARHTQTPTAAAPATSAGGLPFTGLQLGVFALVALALIAGGLALRSTGRQRPTP